MGKVTWGGVSGDDLDNADRSQFKPYDGPPVPDGVYAWKIKMLKKAKTSNDNPQLIVGLELVPRSSRPDDKPYAGFYVTDYIPVMDSTTWRVAPFLDAIGVSGSDFASRTMDDGQKDKWGSTAITKIGRWVNDGKQYILASITTGVDNKGKTRREVSGYWAPQASGNTTSDPEPEETDDSDSQNDAPF